MKLLLLTVLFLITVVHAQSTTIDASEMTCEELQTRIQTEAAKVSGYGKGEEKSLFVYSYNDVSCGSDHKAKKAIFSTLDTRRCKAGYYCKARNTGGGWSFEYGGSSYDSGPSYGSGSSSWGGSSSSSGSSSSDSGPSTRGSNYNPPSSGTRGSRYCPGC